MTTLQVQLEGKTYEFLNEQAAAQGFGSAAEYLAALANEAEANRDYVEEELAKGIQSGPAREMAQADWDELERRVWERELPRHGTTQMPSLTRGERNMNKR